MTRPSQDRLSVGDLELEVVRRGKGRPLLLLHGFQTVPADAPFLDLLGQHAEIIAPSHPGFGDSPRPADFETVYDLVHLYLEVLDTWPNEPVSLMGLSFGGWLGMGEKLFAIFLKIGTNCFAARRIGSLETTAQLSLPIEVVGPLRFGFFDGFLNFSRNLGLRRLVGRLTPNRMGRGLRLS
jgi:hypothetical protein